MLYYSNALLSWIAFVLSAFLAIALFTNGYAVEGVFSIAMFVVVGFLHIYPKWLAPKFAEMRIVVLLDISEEELSEFSQMHRNFGDFLEKIHRQRSAMLRMKILVNSDALLRMKWIYNLNEWFEIAKEIRRLRLADKIIRKYFKVTNLNEKAEDKAQQ